MNMIRSYRCASILTALTFLLLLSSCGDETSADNEMFDADTTSVDTSDQNEERLDKTKKIFYNIPSPMETAALLRKAGAEYDGTILNDVKSVDRYTASSKQALNLGVYGADLSYASVFDQTSESILYTSCAQRLATKLGITNAFTQDVMDRLQENNKNRDSLLHIISENYWTMDAYLKENGRANISALVIAGGWVEGLFIATQISNIAESDDLRTRIAEQSYSLEHLIALVNSYGDDPSLSPIKEDLARVQEHFEGMDLGASSGEITEQEGVTVIGGGSTKAKITDEQLSGLSATISEIRNRYIN